MIFDLGEVCLRGIEREDFTKGLYKWANDQEVTNYMITGLKPSIKDNMVDLYERTRNSGEEVVFSIVEKENDGLIGLVGLYRIDTQIRSAEFRIIIGEKEYWGKGIGTECCKKIIDYGFESLNLNKVWLGVNEENVGGMKSYRKAGFSIEGILKDEVYRNGRYYGVVRMSILKRSWAESMAKTRKKKK